MSFFKNLFCCCTSRDDEFYPGNSSSSKKKYRRILPEEGEFEKNSIVSKNKDKKKKDGETKHSKHGALIFCYGDLSQNIHLQRF